MSNTGQKLLVIMLLAGPAARAAADWLYREEFIRDPTRDRFSVCFDHSCRSIVTSDFTAPEWQKLAGPLRLPAADAAAERTAVADTIAVMEKIIGEKTGTSGDRGGNLAGFGQQGQMDCIDESYNTTTYLKLLQRDGLLKFHRVMNRSTRFGLFAGMPHSTAVIRDVASGQDYAVDSWFFDNGELPVIMPLAHWKSGWRPGDDPHE